MLKRFAQALLEQFAPVDDAGAAVRHDLATCVVLLEAARADDEYTDAERTHIVDMLRARFALEAAEAEELLAEACDARETHPDLFRFTRAVNDHFPPGEKAAIVEDVWRLVYSDGTLTAHEDHLAHKIGKLLNLDHPTVIDAKLRARGRAG